MLTLIILSNLQCRILVKFLKLIIIFFIKHLIYVLKYQQKLPFDSRILSLRSDLLLIRSFILLT